MRNRRIELNSYKAIVGIDAITDNKEEIEHFLEDALQKAEQYGFWLTLLRVQRVA